MSPPWATPGTENESLTDSSHTGLKPLFFTTVVRADVDTVGRDVDDLDGEDGTGGGVAGVESEVDVGGNEDVAAVT